MKSLKSNKKIKLYRGLKTDNFIHRGEQIEESFNNGWRKLLEYRSQGDLSYPEELNDLVIEMNKLQQYTRQYFTDRLELAENYAKTEKGILISITVPIEDILNLFIIEFQNYSKRKDQFDVVYIAKGSDLFKKQKEWDLKIEASYSS